MSSHYCSMLSKFTNLMSDQLFYKELVNSECLSKDDNKDFDENLYELDELGEKVFSDHILMGKRLQKTLYRGNIQDLDDSTDHPPIALTDLALKLFSKTVPNYGLNQLDMDYVSSVSEATRVSPCAMILALIYLERLKIKNSDYLETVSPSGLFVVTMLVASKFLFEDEDDVVTNQIWSEALNLDVKDLNQLEQNFLSAIDWRIYVDSSKYFQYLCGVEKMIAIKQSSFRGWLSYSDICSILQDIAIREILLSYVKRVIRISALSALSYTITVLSIYAAGFVLQCRYSESDLSKENIQLQNDIQLQSSFLDFTNVGFQSGTKLLVDESSDVESVMSTGIVYKKTDFSYFLQNPENLSYKVKRHTDVSYYSGSYLSPFRIGARFNFYINSNSFHHNIVNQTLNGLQLSPASTCIPVSIK